MPPRWGPYGGEGRLGGIVDGPEEEDEYYLHDAIDEKGRRTYDLRYYGLDRDDGAFLSTYWYMGDDPNGNYYGADVNLREMRSDTGAYEGVVTRNQYRRDRADRPGLNFFDQSEVRYQGDDYGYTATRRGTDQNGEYETSWQGTNYFWDGRDW